MLENTNNKIHFEELMNVPNIGILVIDMQYRFVNRIFNEEEEKKILNSQKKILNYAVKKNIPTCLVEYSNIKAGKTIPEIYELVKKIENNLYLTKTKNSAFYEPLVNLFLRNNKVKKLIVMGFHANLCIKETIKDGIEENFEIFTSHDLIADYTQEKKDLAKDFIEKNCKIILFD